MLGRGFVPVGRGSGWYERLGQILHVQGANVLPIPHYTEIQGHITIRFQQNRLKIVFFRDIAGKL